MSSNFLDSIQHAKRAYSKFQEPVCKKWNLTQKELDILGDAVEEILLKLGYIKPGQDLSDADLKFLLGIGHILDAWFCKTEEG